MELPAQLNPVFLTGKSGILLFLSQKCAYIQLYYSNWPNPLSTRPRQNVVWYNNSWLGFLKILNYTKRKRKIYCKKWALICHSWMLRWLIGINLGEIIWNPQIGNIYKDWKSLFLVQIVNFLDWKGLPNVHILFCLHNTSSFTAL